MYQNPYGSMQDMLIKQEGLRTKAYQDTLGFWTIGVGHLLDGPTEEIWSVARCIQVLYEDLGIVYKSLDKYLPWWRDETKTRRMAIVSMCFNLGIHKLLKFKHMLAAWEKGDYEEAAAQALDSRWARQVKSRAGIIRDMILYGGDNSGA